jgi:hypothetical protein
MDNSPRTPGGGDKRTPGPPSSSSPKPVEGSPRTERKQDLSSTDEDGWHKAYYELMTHLSVSQDVYGGLVFNPSTAKNSAQSPGGSDKRTFGQLPSSLPKPVKGSSQSERKQDLSSTDEDGWHKAYYELMTHPSVTQDVYGGSVFNPSATNRTAQSPGNDDKSTPPPPGSPSSSKDVKGLDQPEQSEPKKVLSPRVLSLRPHEHPEQKNSAGAEDVSNSKRPR